jgi:hypothetical protein
MMMMDVITHNATNNQCIAHRYTNDAQTMPIKHVSKHVHVRVSQSVSQSVRVSHIMFG